jgi:hypothetical protein
MDTFSSVCFELVVPIADEKSNGPVANLVFLGLEIDTIEMVIQINENIGFLLFTDARTS